MKSYNVLKKQVYRNGIYSIVPIRFEDRFNIMKWRNEQIYHLRQKEPLTIEDQNRYFDIVVNKLFEQEKPNQLLFSYLENDKCIGYGGLVHINWIDKNAEISFIMATELEEKKFEENWMNYLKLIEQVAFENIDLHKIYTYAFDLRPNLYVALEKANYNEKVTLKEHCLFQNKFIDIIIHSKINKC
jgi:RimJ/RimL family protein N-acetyltransferase